MTGASPLFFAAASRACRRAPAASAPRTGRRLRARSRLWQAAGGQVPTAPGAPTLTVAARKGRLGSLGAQQTGGATSQGRGVRVADGRHSSALVGRVRPLPGNLHKYAGWAGWSVCQRAAHLVPDQRPELVQVDDGAEVVVLPDVEVPHAHLRRRSPLRSGARAAGLRACASRAAGNPCNTASPGSLHGPASEPRAPFWPKHTHLPPPGTLNRQARATPRWQARRARPSHPPRQHSQQQAGSSHAPNPAQPAGGPLHCRRSAATLASPAKTDQQPGRLCAGAAHLAKVARVVLVHHDAVVVLATSVAAPARVLAVLADAAVPSADVPPLLAVLTQPCARAPRFKGDQRSGRAQPSASRWTQNAARRVAPSLHGSPRAPQPALRPQQQRRSTRARATLPQASFR
jgi:hypothetical protein